MFIFYCEIEYFENLIETLIFDSTFTNLIQLLHHYIHVHDKDQKSVYCLFLKSRSPQSLKSGKMRNLYHQHEIRFSLSWILTFLSSFFRL